MKKRIFLIGLASALIMSVAVGGSLAAGQSSVDKPITAPLQAATLSIEWSGAQSSEPLKMQVQDEQLMPGDEIVLKDSYKVDNTGNVDSYIRVTVKKYWTDENGEKDVDLNAANIQLIPNENWLKAQSLFEKEETLQETEVYYYKYPVNSKSSTADLIECIGLPENLNNDYTNKQILLEAVADGVQFAGSDSNDLNAKGILASWGVAADIAADGSLNAVVE